MSILITGGAGFIGSHTAKLLSESGLNVVVLDNLSTGRRENARWGTFIHGDIADATLLRRIFREFSVTAVLHLAASAQVAESIKRPFAYFANNVTGTLVLLEAMLEAGVLQFVYASSSSVYGNSASTGAHEGDSVIPVSPYGESKLAIERVLPWYERAHGLRWLTLRYFNAAGAEDGLGEEPSESFRIIPRAVHAAIGDGPPLEVFGANFPTPDGSAVRDYVHVADIAQANLRALRHVAEPHPGAIVNISSGTGVSVLQIIEAVAAQTGRPVPYELRAARTGDPASVVAKPSTAQEILGWQPVSSSLDEIVSSVLRSLRP